MPTITGGGEGKGFGFFCVESGNTLAAQLDIPADG